VSNAQAQGHPAKILLTKIGLDGHDRGSRLVATFLRDAGMEVVYTGPWQKITDVVNLAIQEDVDVIGISSLATDHLIVPRLMVALRTAGLGQVAVVVGGIVPDNELDMLRYAGVAHVFHPGSSREDIVARVSELVDAARACDTSQENKKSAS
jgi:methylmalonyl-CoA mutase C-terminal domain/subunit